MLLTVKNGRYFIIMVMGLTGIKKASAFNGSLFMYVEKW